MIVRCGSHGSTASLVGSRNRCLYEYEGSKVNGMKKIIIAPLFIPAILTWYLSLGSVVKASQQASYGTHLLHGHLLLYAHKKMFREGI